MSFQSRDSTVERQNGRQELESQHLVDKKTNSGTWPKGNLAYVVISLVFCSLLLCRMTLNLISKFLSIVCYVSVIL